MKKETLKQLRLVIPGILAYLVFLPLAQGSVSIDGLIALDTKNAMLALIVVVSGALYKTLNVRDIAFREPIESVQLNIKKKLLLQFPKWLPIGDLEAIEAKKFMKVFYHFVDKDKSLTEKAGDVYENGALMSTFADLVVISLVAAPIYFVAHCLNAFKDYKVMSIFLCILFCVALGLLHKAKKNHIKLSDDQLDYMIFIYSSEIPDQLAALARAEQEPT